MRGRRTDLTVEGVGEAGLASARARARRATGGEETAERARARQADRFLVAASAVLAESFGSEDMLARVARLAVPELADVCVIDLLDDRGSPRRVASAQALGDERAVEALAPRQVLAPVLQEEIQDARLRERGFRSLVAAPLSARGASLGSLTLASARRSYGAVERALVEELARRVALAVDNARLYQQARQAVGQRDEFLQVAAHELRTPLTTLQLQVQSLIAAADRRASSLEPRDVAKLERIARVTERLTALVNGLLDVSRLSAGRIELQRERFDLRDAARAVIERYRSDAARVGSTLCLRAERPVEGDWDRLRVEQILDSLLSNALKYGPGRPVEVSVDRRDEHAELTVRDQGMGIASEDLGRIFGRFERAVPVRHYGGLGLGLYVARQLAEAHGGTIQARSRPGEGATFTVELPLAAGTSG